MSEAQIAIRVEGLTKSFGAATALGGVDLRVEHGQFLTIFGPNGAGKTTLMRIIATLARPTSGRIEVFGRDAAAASGEIRRRMGLVTHRSLLYASLSAFENVVFFARMFGVSAPEDRARTVLTELGLEHRMDDAVRTYSRGMEQRCAIARALVHEPDILLLDEPFSGLDPDAAARLRDLLIQPGERPRTIILTSHDLTRGADLADRVAILVRGRLAFESATADIPAGSVADIYREHAGARTT